MKLILIRHGRTEWNVQGRVQGRTDIPLDETGRMQAQAVAKCLAGEKIDAIYASPLSRAFDTAAAIAAYHSCRIEKTEELTEIRFGEWEGKTARELEEQYADLWQDWNWILHPEICRKMGAESADEILIRSLKALEKALCENAADATVVFVSHTMPIKLLSAYLIGLPSSKIRRMKLANCSLTEIAVTAPDHGELWVWNDTCHLIGRTKRGEAL